MSKALIIFIGLLLLAILGYFCIYNNSPRIQNDIDTRTHASLSDQGLENITISADGRDIVLTGAVISEAIRQRAEQRAKKVHGVRTVDNQLTVTAPEPVIEPAVEPEPEPEPEPVEALAEDTCQQGFNTLLSTSQINFATNSADINASSNSLLNNLLDVANQCPKAKIEIGGHTDSSGSDDYNLRLSQARASSVMSYLISNGIEASRLTAVGYGETNPIADNETNEGKAKNRRIEFNVKGLSQ